MQARFLRWFKRYHRIVSLLWSIGAYLSIYGLFYDVLAGAIGLQLAVVLWVSIFAIPGHVVLEHALLNLADRWDSDVSAAGPCSPDLP